MWSQKRDRSIKGIEVAAFSTQTIHANHPCKPPMQTIHANHPCKLYRGQGERHDPSKPKLDRSCLCLSYKLHDFSHLWVQENKKEQERKKRRKKNKETYLITTVSCAKTTPQSRCCSLFFTHPPHPPTRQTTHPPLQCPRFAGRSHR